jgi:glycerophosphoryl diester phosphodiesterase
MLILGHRGYHLDVPHNTHAAFERAVEMGLDGIETDVRVSADGVLILYHDRCAPGGQPVSRLNHKDLEALVGYPVPTLESVIAEWADILWDLELKTAAAVEPMVKLLTKYRSTRRFLVTSFLHPAVLDFIQRTGVEGGLLISHTPLDMTNLSTWASLDPRLRTIVWEYETCGEKVLAAAAIQGFRNFVYGPVTLEEHQNLMRWEVTGTITDYPLHLIKTVRGDIL